MPAVPDIPNVYVLHKYFIWADRMRVHFDQVLRRVGPTAGKGPAVEPDMYMSLWYACTYVVIEGWRELRLSDPAVDRLLASPNVELLKRYRNGVFHFQANYFDDRFVALIRDGEDVVAWIRQLREELSRFFLNWFQVRD